MNPVSKADYFEPGKEYVHMIPDSLCTVEQQEVHEKAKKKIPRIYVEQVVVEDSLLELIKPKFAVKDTINPLFDEKPYIWY